MLETFSASSFRLQSVRWGALLTAFFASVQWAPARPEILRPGTFPVPNPIGWEPESGDFMINFASEFGVKEPGLLFLADFKNPESGPQQVFVGNGLSAPLFFNVGAGVRFGNDVVARTRPGSDALREPSSPSSPNVAFSFSADGSLAGTLSVIVKVYDQEGREFLTTTWDNIETTPFPSAGKQNCDVVLRRATEGSVISYSRVKDGLVINEMQEFDKFGAPVGEPVVVSDGLSEVRVCRLNEPGDKLALVGSKANQIVCYQVDFQGGESPVVGPEILVSSHPGAILNFQPCVAGDVDTGDFLCAWTSITAEDEGDIRCRTYDCLGNATSEDFLVNTTAAGIQNSPCAAFGPNGLSAFTWATGGFLGPDWFDVALQVFDANLDPIGGEILVNTDTEHQQSQPEVSFFHDPNFPDTPQLGVRYSSIETDAFGPTGTAIQTGRFVDRFQVVSEPVFFELQMDGIREVDETTDGVTLSISGLEVGRTAELYTCTVLPNWLLHSSFEITADPHTIEVAYPSDSNRLFLQARSD